MSGSNGFRFLGVSSLSHTAQIRRTWLGMDLSPKNIRRPVPHPGQGGLVHLGVDLDRRRLHADVCKGAGDDRRASERIDDTLAWREPLAGDDGRRPGIASARM